MPEVADPPEYKPEAELKRRFGGIGAPAYQRMMQDIERGWRHIRCIAR